MKAVNNAIINAVKWINLELKTKEAPVRNNSAILKSEARGIVRLATRRPRESRSRIAMRADSELRGFRPRSGRVSDDSESLGDCLCYYT